MKRQAGFEDDVSVIRHAPDDNHYHMPDAELRRLVGRVSATIPAANEDGTSKGFNPTKAGPVHIDPGAPDGGVIFDARAVCNEDIVNAMATSSYTHEAYYKLGTTPAVRGVAEARLPRVDPMRGNSYVAPSSAVDGRQLSQEYYEQ